MNQERVDPDEPVDRLRSLDPDAWEQLYRRMYRPLLGHARRRLGSSDRAEDAVSETMERAVDGLDRFSPVGDNATRRWLFGILRNVIREQWRDADRSSRLPDRLPPPVEADGPADTIVRNESYADLRAAFDELSDDDQETLALRLGAELSPDEVAEIQGRRSGAVRMAQSRALGRLRDRLERKEGHEQRR